MFKTKLLILLLTSTILFGCTKNSKISSPTSFSVSYIGGEYDGLLLNNLLTSHLERLDIYDQKSIYEIRSKLRHESNLFITNIDNTSDRESIDTIIRFNIVDIKKDCLIFSTTDSVSQFYIIASSDKLLSNQKAVKNIKKNNTDALVKTFINKLNRIELSCDE